jgi:hypothetical protein
MLTDSPASTINIQPTTDSPASRRSSTADTSDDEREQQASDLILQAMNRSKRGSSVATTLPTPQSGATGGALALLGRKAAAIANPVVTAQNASPEVMSPTQLEAPLAPEVTVSVNPVPGETSPTNPKASDSSFFGSLAGSRGRSGGKEEKSKARSHKVNKISKTRSISPFFRTRRRSSVSSSAPRRVRDSSPPVGALSDHGGESDADIKYRPRDSAFSRAHKSDDAPSDESGSESEGDEVETETEYDDESLSREIMNEDGWVEDVFDEETEKNTEINAVYLEGDAGGLGGPSDLGGTITDFGEEVEEDLTGEGESCVEVFLASKTAVDCPIFMWQGQTSFAHPSLCSHSHRK